MLFCIYILNVKMGEFGINKLVFILNFMCSFINKSLRLKKI